MVSERYLRGPLCHLDWPSTMKKNDLSKDIWKNRNDIILSIGGSKIVCFFMASNQKPREQELTSTE